MTTNTNRALNADDLERFTKQFESNPAYRLAQNAVTTTSLEDVALDRSVVNQTATSMSTLLDDWEATNQKQSGRCWLFAGLNLLRAGAAKTMDHQGFRVLPELPALLGQAREGQLLARGDHRDGRPGRG